MKSEHTSIKNLNPIFTEPLQKFDRLHIRLMGTQSVVTSVNTGRHWGSIKKENRPVGWENFIEAQVREFSNSKHYTDEALDFRRRCPYGELTYYDSLTKAKQREFKTKMYECFPDEFFDVTFSRLCIHVEHDPDFDVRKPRGLVSEDLKPRIKDRPGTMISDEVEPIELPPLKIAISAIEKIEHDWAVDKTIVAMGAINFLTKHFTGYFWFKRKIGVKNDQSIWGRLLELINVLITKLRGTKS